MSKNLNPAKAIAEIKKMMVEKNSRKTVAIITNQKLLILYFFSKIQ